MVPAGLAQRKLSSPIEGPRVEDPLIKEGHRNDHSKESSLVKTLKQAATTWERKLA